jgi:hypothetical protein
MQIYFPSIFNDSLARGKKPSAQEALAQLLRYKNVCASLQGLTKTLALCFRGAFLFSNLCKTVLIKFSILEKGGSNVFGNSHAERL